MLKVFFFVRTLSVFKRFLNIRMKFALRVCCRGKLSLIEVFAAIHTRSRVYVHVFARAFSGSPTRSFTLSQRRRDGRAIL